MRLSRRRRRPGVDSGLRSPGAARPPASCPPLVDGGRKRRRGHSQLSQVVPRRIQNPFLPTDSVEDPNLIRPRRGLRDWLRGEFADDPVEALEVVEEPSLSVVAGVVEDPDRASVAALADRLREGHVEITLADDENLLSGRFTIGGHAIEVEEVQVRQHLRERFLQSRQMAVAVVLVVDDADVRHGEGIAHRYHIFRLPAPAAVVVDGDAAARLRGLLGHGP